MKILFVAFLALLLARSTYAAPKNIATIEIELFGAPKAAWSPTRVLVDFDPALEQPRVRLPSSAAGHPLNARLDFKRLRGYDAWVAAQRAQGGAQWGALSAVLDELGEGPAMALTHEALPRQGRIKLWVGLRRGSKFELYATVAGVLSPCASRLCFEPESPVFSSTSAQVAWTLLKPIALKQAKNAANR